MKALEYLSNSNEVYVWKVVNDLQEAGIELYLTGSRFFGSARPDSDWDFFCGLSDKHTIMRYNTILTNNGFHLELRHASYYGDLNTAYVYHRADVFRPEIHIQVVFDANLKDRIQSSKNFKIVYGVLSKNDRRALWNMAYNLAR